MKVLVTTEERFVRCPDCKIWSGGSGSYSFWTRYLDVFDGVGVLARVIDNPAPPPRWKLANGPGVAFHVLPYAIGPSGHARELFSMRRAIKHILNRSDALILRAFSAIAPHIEQQLSPLRPFGIELVGDPHDVFGPGSLDHPMRPFLRWYFTRQLKRQCRKACAIAYVTREALQRRYRAAADAFSTHYSSIELPEEAFSVAPRIFPSPLRSVRIVTLGSLERPYKGVDVLIHAIALCRSAHPSLEIELKVVGDGRCRPALQQRTERLGLTQQIAFLGQLPSGCAVRDELDASDLFALASRTEGLPRAMIEAMARGLPCIGSSAGGIPELLSADEMVPRDDSEALASLIHQVVTEPRRMDEMSARNVFKAREYQDHRLARRRRQFLAVLRDKTESWNRAVHRA